MLPAVGGGELLSSQAIPLPWSLLMASIICPAAFNLIGIILYLAGAHVCMIRPESSKDRACLWRAWRLVISSRISSR